MTNNWRMWGSLMKKGFITIATGDERYYRMARTLLRSYRQTCTDPLPFALIADRENEFTSEFDSVIILEHPSYSWMDKLSLLQVCPFDENIFIDADCLIYQDINFLWESFSAADDFSCFGKVLPMESHEGWFTAEAAQVYPIKFITHLHGICYFIRKGDAVNRMSALCEEIIDNYGAVQYKGFNDQLADEPVFALAMAILDFKPIERKAEYYCFVPFATEINTNYYKKAVTFSNPKDGQMHRCHIVHWGNQNTKKYPYRFDAKIVNTLEKNNQIGFLQYCLFEKELLKYIYQIQDKFSAINSRVSYLCKRLFSKFSHKDH